MKTYCFVFFFTMTLVFTKNSFAQDAPSLQQVGVNEMMGDFTLKTYQGNEFSMSKLKGKNVLLVFPRGKVTPTIWCPFCYYQYVELADLAKSENWQKKYDLEIFYLLPYPNDSIISWMNGAQKGLSTIEKWKNKDSYKEMTKETKGWMDYITQFYPQKFELVNQQLDLSIPILIDKDHFVSGKLGLYMEEWGGTKVQQNIPTVFIIDKNGVIRFKYHSQYTNDRVNASYISEFLKKML